MLLLFVYHARHHSIQFESILFVYLFALDPVQPLEVTDVARDSTTKLTHSFSFFFILQYLIYWPNWNYYPFYLLHLIRNGLLTTSSTNSNWIRFSGTIRTTQVAISSEFWWKNRRVQLRWWWWWWCWWYTHMCLCPLTFQRLHCRVNRIKSNLSMSILVPI